MTFDLANFDPTVSSAGGTITVPYIVYSRLLGFVGGPNYDPFKLELEPEFASAWERTPDSATFTFQIRDDVNWQNIAPLNGRKFVAADAKYAHERYATDGAHKSYWRYISHDDIATSLTLQPWIYAVDEEPTAANGLLSEWNPRYDPDEAKKLLAAVGAPNLSF